MGYRTGFNAMMAGKKEDKERGQTGFDKSVGNNTRHPVYVKKRGEGEVTKRAMWEASCCLANSLSLLALFSFASSFPWYESCVYGAISGVSVPTYTDYSAYKLIQRERTASGLSPSKKPWKVSAHIYYIDTLIFINIEIYFLNSMKFKINWRTTKCYFWMLKLMHKIIKRIKK